MLLEKVNTPEDIKGFSAEELELLCKEIREYMVECCSQNPGHLGSSLGAVELIVGLHYIYSTPSDKLVFDVSHQAYAHKILTGRREEFKTLRTFGGISGFTHPSESPYDSFVAGHASNSVSAALGFSTAAHLSGSDARTVAVIGDGALTGGLAFEGLNNAGASQSDILVILNDNNMAISSNIGALHNHLLAITTSPIYNKVRAKVSESLRQRRIKDCIYAWAHKVKSLIVHKTKGDLFEIMGFRYFGPIDGNNIKAVTETLAKLRDIKGPKLLHVITTKGKGYAPAEANPVTWHAPGKFNPATGERYVKTYPTDRYQDVFGQTLCDLAALDSKVVGITPAMLTGCGMDKMAKIYPERVFDVGIDEEHAVTFSAGLASAGFRPFCNIYSSFAQRAYDEFIHDVALESVPVVLCLDRAGIVGEDGPTHHGAFDLAAFRPIPNTVIAAPSNELELRNMLYTAYRHTSSPFIVRYPRGLGQGAEWKGVDFEEIPLGRGKLAFSTYDGVSAGSDSASGSGGARTAIVALGPVLANAIEAAIKSGADVDVYDMRFLKPFDNELINSILARYDKIVTIEDGALKGGLYSEVLEHNAARKQIIGLGLPDEFVPHGSVAQLQKFCGIDVDSITAILSV